MRKRVSDPIRDQHGYVMVTAIILTTLMVSIGLVAAGMIDNGTRRTREDRERETALMVDEGVLYAQSLVMQTAWPSSPTTDPSGRAQFYPNRCDLTTGADFRCPNPQTLAAANSTTPASAAFGNVDAVKDVSWATKVRDNGGALATSYDPTKADLVQAGCFTSGPCTYDANGDNELWVQSQSIVRGKPRNVVARLRLEELAESIPKTAVVSGALSITNSGNHGGTPIIDATGSQVIVRCASPGTDDSCANFEDGQIKPGTPQSDAAASNMMTPEQLQRFKQRAIIDRTYYAGCPESPYKLSGPVVWVEGCLNPPNLTSKIPTVSCPTAPAGLDKDCVNTEDEPGLLIWHCGMADMAGGWTYRGVLYIANNSDGTCQAPLNKQRGNGTCSKQPNATDEDAITTNGGFGVWGAIAVDGPACLKLGSNGVQVSYDPRVFEPIESYGTVGLVQNTWRELDPTAF
jgi:Tfp pilus assembly protein PilX